MNKSTEQPAARSTDMLAAEAIEHIKKTPYKALHQFVSEDEDRITVLRAWQEKQQEAEQEFIGFYRKLRSRMDKKLKGWKGRSGGVVNDRVIGGLLFLPDLFYLMAKLLSDPEVPTRNKGALLAGTLYVMSPIDVLPDFFPVVGWVDDLVVAILALNKFLDVDDEVIRVKVEAYWLNDKDFFKTFKQLLDTGDQAIEFLPRKFLSYIKGNFNTEKPSDKDSEQ